MLQEINSHLNLLNMRNKCDINDVKKRSHILQSSAISFDTFF